MIRTPRTLIRRKSRAVSLLCLVASVCLAAPIAVSGAHDRGITADSEGADSRGSPEKGQAPHDEISCGICQIIHSPKLSVAGVPLEATESKAVLPPLLDTPTPAAFAIDANHARAPPEVRTQTHPASRADS